MRPLLGAALLCAGCASPPGSYVVLLPDADGSTGRLAVTDARGTRVLERPMQALPLDRRGDEGFAPTEGQLQQDFGAALAVRPPLPETLVVRFERSGARLSAADLEALRAFAERVRRRPAPELLVVGHTDTVGGTVFNERLGLARAQAVVAVLVAEGVTPLSLTLQSRGERMPAVHTADEVDEPRNRRVVITVR